MQSTVLPALKLSFDAIFYYVRDIDRSIEFYRQVLGLKLVSHDFVARCDVDGVLFELVPSPHGQPISGTGNARICLQVNDIRETVGQLRERRIQTGDVETEPGGLLSFFHDPDDNELCLWQYVRARRGFEIA